MNYRNVSDNDVTVFDSETKLLDDAKRRYHTADDSLIYFKYPRNSGIFIKTNKEEKECVKNKIKNKIKNKNNVKARGGIKPKINYLRKERSTYAQSIGDEKDSESVQNIYITGSHSKLVESENGEKPLNKTRTRCPENLKVNSKLKIRNDVQFINKNLKSEKSQNINEKIEYDNPSQHIKNRQLQIMKEENEKLKRKLQNVIKSLQNILINNCERNYDQITTVNCETDFQKKHTKHQSDDGLTFSLTNQCSNIKNDDSFEMISKKQTQLHFQSLNNEMIMILLDNLGISKPESPSEKTKVLNSQKYFVQLEKQNRMILHSLNELKERLKSIYELQIKKVETLRNKNDHFVASNKKKTSFTKYVVPSANIRRKTNTPNELTIPMENQPQMLSEMINFSKMIKNNYHRIKESKWLNFETNRSHHRDSDQSKNILSKLNKNYMESDQNFSFTEIPRSKNKANVEVSVVQRKTNYRRNGLQSFSKTTHGRNSQQHLKQANQTKNMIYMHKQGLKIKPICTNGARKHTSFENKTDIYTEYESSCVPSISKAIKANDKNVIILPKRVLVSWKETEDKNDFFY